MTFRMGGEGRGEEFNVLPLVIGWPKSAKACWHCAVPLQLPEGNAGEGICPILESLKLTLSLFC